MRRSDLTRASPRSTLGNDCNAAVSRCKSESPVTARSALPPKPARCQQITKVAAMPSAERTIDTAPRRRLAPARRGRDGVRWTVARVERLFALPFPDLMFRAQEVHRAHHAPSTVQLSRLISIKTGGCPEDCGYCPQAKRYHTGVADEAMLDLDTVVAAARAARARGRDALLHGRRLARTEGARSAAGARDGAGSEGARPRDVLHARPAQGRARRRRSSPRGSTITTTISTPRPSSTAK